MREGWTVSSWAPPEKEVYKLPMPNFSEVFRLQKEHEFYFFIEDLTNFCLRLSEIDAAEVETHADQMLGQVFRTEYDLLLSKLAGTRGNQVFSFFGIEAPQRAAEALLAVQKAGGKAGGTGGVTATLEKKKRKKGGSGPGGAKRSKLLEFLTSSPLRSAGESEDNGETEVPSPLLCLPLPLGLLQPPLHRRSPHWLWSTAPWSQTTITNSPRRSNMSWRPRSPM